MKESTLLNWVLVVLICTLLSPFWVLTCGMLVSIARGTS